MGKYALLSSLMLFASLAMSAEKDGSEFRILAPSTYSTHLGRSPGPECTEQVSVLNSRQQEIISLCKKDYRSCRFEGACVIETPNGKVGLSYHSFDEIADQVYFSMVETKICPFGYGYVSGKVYRQLKTKHLCLDPFYSVAADLQAYNVGDVLYVPVLDGARLPTGEIHDGFVIVRDSSTFHQGAGDYRIAFFTGFLDAENSKNVFAKKGLTDIDKHISYRLATAEEAAKVRTKRNFPSLPAQLLEQGK